MVNVPPEIRAAKIAHLVTAGTCHFVASSVLDEGGMAFRTLTEHIFSKRNEEIDLNTC